MLTSKLERKGERYLLEVKEKHLATAVAQRK